MRTTGLYVLILKICLILKNFKFFCLIIRSEFVNFVRILKIIIEKKIEKSRPPHNDVISHSSSLTHPILFFELAPNEPDNQLKEHFSCSHCREASPTSFKFNWAWKFPTCCLWIRLYAPTTFCHPPPRRWHRPCQKRSSSYRETNPR